MLNSANQIKSEKIEFYGDSSDDDGDISLKEDLSIED
jgi:hypothetical protein